MVNYFEATAVLGQIDESETLFLSMKRTMGNVVLLPFVNQLLNPSNKSISLTMLTCNPL